MPLTPKPTRGIKIFFSYAHKDEALRDELERQLSMLRRQGFITSWHDRKIGAGEEWAGKIDEHLNTAHLILLLVSADFIASHYCYDIEMERALERHRSGEACVIPIILRPTADWEMTAFGNLHPLPANGKPVTKWSNRDEAFKNVALGIRKAIEKLIIPSDTAQIFQSFSHSIMELSPPTHPKAILR